MGASAAAGMNLNGAYWEAPQTLTQCPFAFGSAELERVLPASHKMTVTIAAPAGLSMRVSLPIQSGNDRRRRTHADFD